MRKKKCDCWITVVRENQYDTEDEALDQRVTREPRAVPRDVLEPNKRTRLLVPMGCDTGKPVAILAFNTKKTCCV